MIDLERRFIFVHIPKTAGSSVTDALGFQWQNHKDIARYRKELGKEKFAEFYTFTIVRNPWDRLLSDYCFQTRMFGHRATKLYAYDDRGTKRSFGAWVRKALDEPEGYPPKVWGGTVSKNIHRWSPQLDWISLDGEMAVDYVGRMERLSEDFGKICQKLGLPSPELARRKRVFHRHYSSYYDDETRDLVADYYRKDIEAFGYAFVRQDSPSLLRQWLSLLRR